MRVLVIVAGRILSSGHHHLRTSHFLRLVGNDISFALLGHNMPDITLLRLEVIRDLIRLVLVLAVLEDRLTFPLVL